MRVLIVHSHPSPGSFSRHLADTAENALRQAGHDVTVIHLDDEGFRPAMSAAERLAYETDAPILDPDVARHAALIADCDALLFVYPTWWAAPPAIMKGWLERVLVPGVAFSLDPQTRKVRPALRHIRRLGLITTYGSSHWYVRLLGDPGRRIIMRAVGMLCHRPLRRTVLGLYGMDTATETARERFVAHVEQTLSRW
jgi:putative NADPH-quinone reductase